MTIIEKIKKSVEGATGMPFLYHAAGELNELITRCGELPVAYSFLIDSGTIDDVNGRYHERVTIAVMFCDKTEFDFNALENEQIIDRMKVKAYKWMQSLRMSNTLRVVSVNNTQRLYDNTTDILTGFAVNITIEDVAGVGECELPQVVIDLDKNGSYDVVGVDKVRVNVQPKLEELEITENGEYLPPTDIAGFSKVVANVLPKITDLVATENDKEYLPADYGADAFGKVKTEIPVLIKENLQPTSIRSLYSNVSPNSRPLFSGVDLRKAWGLDAFDFTYCKEFDDAFRVGNDEDEVYLDFTGLNVKSVTKLWRTFGDSLYKKKCFADFSDWDTSNLTNLFQCWSGNNPCEGIVFDLSGWSAKKLVETSYIFGFTYVKYPEEDKGMSLVGYKTLEFVKANNICVFDGLNVNMSFRSPGTYISFKKSTLIALLNGLADRTGQESLVMNMGATNLAKLTEEDIAIATNKNWTIV